MNEKIRKIVSFLPAMIGIFLIILINVKLSLKYHDLSKILVIMILLFAPLIYREIWSQILEKLGKIAFLIPLILGTPILMWIHNDIQNAISFEMCIVFILGLSSRNWWKMARDEEYRRKDHEYWAVKPWYKRKNAQFGLGHALESSIILSFILVAAITYFLFIGVIRIAILFFIPLSVLLIIIYITYKLTR